MRTRKLPCPCFNLRNVGWKCDRYPEILSAIDQDGKFLGLLPLNIPKIQPGSSSTWIVGVQVEQSFRDSHKINDPIE